MHLSLVTALLLIALAVLGWLLWRETKQRAALHGWLRTDAPGELPDGEGQWREIFAALERRERGARREANELAAVIERFRLATDSLPDGVILLDGGDHIERINAAASRHLGLDPARDVGTLVQQLVRQPAFLDYLDGFRAGRLDAVSISLAGDAPGTTLTLTLVGFPGGGTLLLTRDVSDSLRIDAMRRDFIANVSHELRTPATVIYGFLEQMTGDEPPQGEEAQRFLRLMMDQALRMNRLVEDLLTLSRLENSPPPEDQEIVIEDLLDTLCAEGRALSAGRHRVERGAPCPARVRGNPDELRSALANLLSNAIRYTPEGGAITLTCAHSTEGLELGVQDSGIGIAAEHLPRLTERFYRVDRGRSTATGGTGLGLAIVKHVLTRHQAQLAIDSAPGQGSHFRIWLPAGRLVD